MRTAWYLNGQFLGVFDTPGTFKLSAMRFGCVYCGEVFAQAVPLDNPNPWWYFEAGNCGCKKHPVEGPFDHAQFRLYRWNMDTSPPPMELLAQEFLYQMNQLEFPNVNP